MMASGFAGTCSPEAARFTSDKRVCDACLATDFSASPVPEFVRATPRFIFLLSSNIAVVPSFFVLRHYQVRGWSQFLGAFAMAAVVGGIMVGLCWLAWCIFGRMGNHKHARQNPDEALREAERFYYLAVWAALTNKAKFGRRMLAQAKLMGFSDTTRLHDQTLSHIAA